MANTASAPSTQFIEVNADYHGQRIDNFLLRTLKGVPKSKIYSILRKGEVRVNRGRIRPDYRLQQGDTVRIPPLRMAEEVVVRVAPALADRLQAALLYEDHELLVIDKPAGLAVHQGSGVELGLIEALRAVRADLDYLELVHRLDRATSGCLMLAKTPAALRALHQALRAGAVDKRYLALVRGHWNLGEYEARAALRKNTLRGGERMVAVSAAGKTAVTHFKPITLKRSASLLEVRITTGRTHQIRVHAAHLGHPLAGDAKYGDADFNRQLAQRGLRRLFLHAHSLAFTLGGRERAFSAPLEPALQAVLEGL